MTSLMLAVIATIPSRFINYYFYYKISVFKSICKINEIVMDSLFIITVHGYYCKSSINSIFQLLLMPS